MRSPGLIYLAFVMASLVFSTASAAKTAESINDTPSLVVTDTAAPMGELMSSAALLTREDVQLRSTQFTRTAASTYTKRKRTIKPKFRSKARKPGSRLPGLTAQPSSQHSCGTTTCTCANDDECDVLFSSTKCKEGTAVHNTTTSGGQCESAD